MKTQSSRLFPLFLLFWVLSVSAQRTEIPLNNNWQFTGGSVTGAVVNKTVDLPHTWNALDAQEGISYFRGEGTYLKTFVPETSWKGQRTFIRFEGVMTIAKVYLNGELLGEHRGGYSAFVFELTAHLKEGVENELKVVADNSYTLEVLPLFGDFDIYGGIYRPVSLIVTPQLCISPVDFASPGIYLKQKNVSERTAQIDTEVKLSNVSGAAIEADMILTLADMNGQVLQTLKNTLTIAPGESTSTQKIQIERPHLWNGKVDPYLYSVKVELVLNGKATDSVIQPLGLRFFNVDPNEGFFLNGKLIPLHGVSRHQDRRDKGNALSYPDHREDMDLMLEMGINALRLAHYQHAQPIYQMADSAGIIVWAEMPWVGGPGALAGGSNGYEPTDAFHNNARQQLTELIRQNYNHPSICFWSIFNEIQNPEKPSPIPFINELNTLAKKEDPSRITVGASMLDPKENIHNITDAIAWNRYFGWYYGNPSEMGDFLDKVHKTNPKWCIGISEYGAGASIYQHSQKLKKPNPFGSPHPEEYQNFYLEEHLKIFNERPFVWGTFVWNMFDFGSYFRREGGMAGINDKGLVTFDRKTKKDAFYLYKANWSNEPVIYITSRRHLFRYEEKTNVKVYSNLPQVSLIVNGENLGSKVPEEGIVIWENIELKKGNNGIQVSGIKDSKTYSDDCVWVLDTAFGTRQVAIILDLTAYIPYFLVAGVVILFFIWRISWRNKAKTVRWKRISARVFFFLLLFIMILVLAFNILIKTALG